MSTRMRLQQLRSEDSWAGGVVVDFGLWFELSQLPGFRLQLILYAASARHEEENDEQ